ncbi:hypothetical protein, partial [Nocardia neocaledoniensis]|uniref:hypothetical protein n=1 Tax=Nocardia neocaledoniensis TaxID=236511 RepID=UPI001C9957B6
MADTNNEVPAPVWGPGVLAARLRDAVTAASLESVAATRRAEQAGLSLTRDLIELVELRRKVLAIADQLDSHRSVPALRPPGSGIMIEPPDTDRDATAMT